jgi:hypothetical protein
MIIVILIFNAALYIAITRINQNPQLFQMVKAFPESISNKQNSGFNYEQN